MAAGAQRASERWRWTVKRAPKHGRVHLLVVQLKERAHSLGTMAKILLAYFQVLHTFASHSSVRWPSTFYNFLDTFGPLSFDLFSAYPVGCRFDFEVTFTAELAGVLLLPVCGFVLLMAVARVAAQAKLPPERRDLMDVMLRPETCTLVLWLFLVLYPTLAKTALLPFDCVRVGDEFLLRANPAVVCGKPVDIVLGVVGTAVYSVGFPLLCWVDRRVHLAKSARCGGVGGTPDGASDSLARSRVPQHHQAASRRRGGE